MSQSHQPSHKQWLLPLTASLAAFACGETTPSISPPASTRFIPAHTLQLGASDNAEVVRAIPGTARALVASSKARKLSLVEIAGGALTEIATAQLFAADATESELTSAAMPPHGTFVALSRTLIHHDSGGAVDGCSGEVVLADLTAGPTFGAVLAEIPVGPMPDSLAFSPDGAWLAVGNERDVVWGKCEGVQGLELPSLSLIEIGLTPAASIERLRYFFTGADDSREPEGVAFSADGETLIVSLQDSHEVAALSLPALIASIGSTPPALDAHLLAPNGTGADAWPDGVAAFVDNAGTERFAIAGEANDTIMFVDRQGVETTRLELSDADIPANFPRATDGWGPLFRPDAAAACHLGGKTLLGVSLKHSGALAIVDASDAGAPRLTQVLKVGADDQPTPEDGSSVAPEGVACASDPAFFIVANEGESSVTLLLPE